jgi:hypothetical protein
MLVHQGHLKKKILGAMVGGKYLFVEILIVSSRNIVIINL